VAFTNPDIRPLIQLKALNVKQIKALPPMKSVPSLGGFAMYVQSPCFSAQANRSALARLPFPLHLPMAEDSTSLSA
jgi:hypothetical protein